MTFRYNTFFTFKLSLILSTFFTSLFAQLKLPSSQVNIEGSGLTFHFEFVNSNQTILMGLESNQDVDYFALGFAGEGSWGMDGFDMVAFIFQPSGASVDVMDLYSSHNGRPPTDTSLGGTSDYRLIDFFVGNGKRQVLFERKYDTGDQYDYTFTPGQNGTKIAMSWAWVSNGQPDLSYHGRTNRGTIMTELYNGLDSNVNGGSGGRAEKIIKVHSYMMLIAWGVLIDIALWLARYHKTFRFVVLVHLFLVLVIYAATIVMTTLVLTLDLGDDRVSNVTAHYYMGLSILGIALIQVLVGFLFWFKLASSKATKTIFPLATFHLVFGLCLYLITKAQIILGLYIWKRQYTWTLGVWYGVLIALWVIQEFFYRMKIRILPVRQKKYLAKGKKTGKYEKLMEQLNTNTPVSVILANPDLKDLKWAILDNKVFAVKGFIHPGGNFILKEIHGREIGRYLYGAYGLESVGNTTQHFHSKKADHLVQKNLIGLLSNGPQILTPLNSAENKQLTVNPDKMKCNWSLFKKTDLSPHTAKFEFGRFGYEIDPWVRDIRQLGRHMKVSNASHSKTRLYTLVLSQTDCRTQRRNLLWNRTDYGAELAADVMNARSKTLPLIIKKYDVPGGKPFSSFLHGCGQDTDHFIIEGPYGTGLGLTPESTGVHYIFAAGTGILPFLDLFDYLLESVLAPDSVTNIFRNGFKLHIYASFLQMNDFVGLDICEKLGQACRENGMEDAFMITIRAKDAREKESYAVTKDSFDNGFVQKHVSPDCEKAYICGPPAFNKQLPVALGEIGVSKNKIVIV